MPASNIFQQFGLGQQQAQQEQRAQQNQAFNLEQQEFQRGQQFLQLDDQRKKALFTDAREVNTRLGAGDVQGALGVLSERVGIIEQLGGDTTDTREIADLLATGNIQGAQELLTLTEQVGVQQGFLKDLTSGGPVSVQSAKILDDGTVIEVLKRGGRRVISPTGELLTGDAAREAVKVSRDQAFNRKKEIARLGQLIRREEAKEGLLTDQQTAIQRGNIQRLGTLSGTSSGRVSSIKKATKFKLALEKGEASSGAGRKGASFIPGVFTSQGQFDEEFNAFAEVAARQQLKASGETRPTDSDVKGMKEAMFGIGRDKDVNIQLLTDFINDQNAQNNELDQLIEASRGGALSEFTFTPAPQNIQTDTSTLSDDELFK